MNFPDYFGFNWDAFDECLLDYCTDNYVVLLIGADHIDPEFEKDVKILKLCLKAFNKVEKYKIEIME
jgi:hypothetical protein